MKKYKYVLFDWNGTLLDDLQINIDIENHLLGKRGLPALESKDFYLENFDFPIKAFYERCGFDFSKEDYNVICDEYAELFDAGLEKAGLFENVPDVLEKMKAAEMKLVIISASHMDILWRQVEKFGIAGYFDDIIGVKDHKGTSKVETALEWLSVGGIDPKEAVFIGDTTHDVQTAKAIGCDCLLVAAGHNSERRLRETLCPVFESLTEAAQYLLQ